MKKLRDDITGLRAIAVISVTLFHICQSLLPDFKYIQGGFVGVDIFFVISGYLMTRIIISGLDKNSFSLYTFYTNRAKRIAPALLVTIILTLLVGYFILGTGDLKRLGYQALYALLFVSNIFFASNTDYFANAALNQPLLHTWSLSVEWQFYIFYPFVLMLCHKYVKKEHIKHIILFLCIALAIFGIVYTHINAKASYFMLYSRAYEMLFGAVAFFYPIKIKSISPRLMEIAGLILIALSLFFVNEDSGWPTIYSLLPCIGTYICIAANTDKTVLGNVVLQKLGLYSYSIYLIHWPVIVFVTQLGFDAFVLSVLVIIMLLSYALYRSVETRRSYGYKTTAIYAIFGAAAFALTINGGAWRFNQTIPSGSLYGGKTIDHTGDELDLYGRSDRQPDFILTGDSFARHYTRNMLDKGVNIITVFKDGCYSYKNYVTRRPEGVVDEKCAIRYENMLKAARKYADLPIVIGQDWERYQRTLVTRATHEYAGVENFYNAIFADLKALIEALPEREIYVILNPAQPIFDIGSTCMFIQRMDNALSSLLKNTLTCSRTRHLKTPLINAHLKAEIGKYKNVHIIDPNEAICDSEGNCQILTNDYIPVFQDGLHYSITGSAPVVDLILKTVLKDKWQH